MEKENEEFDELEAKQFIKEKLESGVSEFEIRISCALGMISNKSIRIVYKEMNNANALIQEIFSKL